MYGATWRPQISKKWYREKEAFEYLYETYLGSIDKIIKPSLLQTHTSVCVFFCLKPKQQG
jgi:hypothetical protein